MAIAGTNGKRANARYVLLSSVSMKPRIKILRHGGAAKIQWLIRIFGQA